MLALVVVIALVANLFVPSVFRGSGPAFVVGVIIFSGLISQPALLAIWAVFGIEPVAKRISRVSGIFLLGWFSWMLGVAMAGPSISAGDAIITALFSIGLQTLLAVAVRLYRWRSNQVLCLGNSCPTPVAPFQFSVKQILAWTTIVAVALVLFRGLFGINTSMGSMRGLAPLLGMGLLFSLEISLVTISSLELCLGQQAKVFWFALLCGSQLIFPIVVFIVLGMMDRRGVHPDQVSELIGGCLLFFGSQTAILCLVLTLIRSLGFRLVPRGGSGDNVKR